jgi:hypothetical protein
MQPLSNHLRPLEIGTKFDPRRRSWAIPSIYPETLFGTSSKLYDPPLEKHRRGQE